MKFGALARVVRAELSPSSRRAWIEITIASCTVDSVSSRPPRGGRGLKSVDGWGEDDSSPSPSSRRAWIEISPGYFYCDIPIGRSPRGGRGLKYGIEAIAQATFQRRPPRGGRGLKYAQKQVQMGVKRSPSSRRAWIEIIMTTYRELIARRRPPRGGRGLKSKPLLRDGRIRTVALLAEGVD